MFYRPRFRYELPCAFAVTICVHGLLSIPMNRPAEHHRTQSAKHSNEARVIVDRFDRKNNLLATNSSQHLQAEI